MFHRILLITNKLVYRIGRKLYMHARGDVANDMQKNGELMLQKAVVRAVTPKGGRGIFFDVGANVGDWTKNLLKYIESMGDRSFDVYCFEPVPATMSMLKTNISLDQRVHYEELALSAATGEAIIYLNGNLAGTNSMHSPDQASQNHSIVVKKISAADFCAQREIPHIDLMKVDTDGHDAEVILGCLPLLRQKRIGVLQFEYNHRWIFSRHYLKDVFDMLSGLPYRIGKVQRNHIKLYNEWNHELEKFFEGNYAIISEEMIPFFNCRVCTFDKSNVVA